MTHATSDKSGLAEVLRYEGWSPPPEAQRAIGHSWSQCDTELVAGSICSGVGKERLDSGEEDIDTAAEEKDIFEYWI